MNGSLDSRYRVARLAEADAVGEAEVIAFWDREGAMPEAVARERVAEVAYVALAGDELAGVSTVYLCDHPQLRCRMWHFRTFVGHEHRRSSLAVFLMQATRRHLEREFAAGRDTRAPGVMIEIENPDLRRTRSQAVITHPASPDARWVFVGENARGYTCFVSWFPGASAPLP